MQKTIKKAGLFISMVGLMTMTLAGCAKETECKRCYETKKCYEYEISLGGSDQTIWLCDDCAEWYEEMIKLSGGIFKKK